MIESLLKSNIYKPLPFPLNKDFYIKQSLFYIDFHCFYLTESLYGLDMNIMEHQ